MAEKYINMHLRMNKELCFVATENSKIIGIGLCMLKPKYNKEIIDSHILIVHPDYRRKKVATKLLKKIISKANNKFGIDEIESSVTSLTNFPISWYNAPTRASIGSAPIASAAASARLATFVEWA